MRLKKKKKEKTLFLPSPPKKKKQTMTRLWQVKMGEAKGEHYYAIC